MIHAAMGQPEEAITAYRRASSAYTAIGHYLVVALITVDELVRVRLPYQADRLTERQSVADEAQAAWRRGGGALLTEDDPMPRPPSIAPAGRAVGRSETARHGETWDAG